MLNAVGSTYACVKLLQSGHDGHGPLIDGRWAPLAFGYFIWMQFGSGCGIMVCKGGHRAVWFQASYKVGTSRGIGYAIQPGDGGSVVRVYASGLWCTVGATRSHPQ